MTCKRSLTRSITHMGETNSIAFPKISGVPRSQHHTGNRSSPNRMLRFFSATRDHPRPRGFYRSTDRSMTIWLMGTDHLRLVASSTTASVTTLCQTLNYYLEFIGRFLLREQLMFAFHPKFAYLTSSIEDLSGLRVILHCTTTAASDSAAFAHQLCSMQEHLCYRLSAWNPSTMIISNRPLLGLNENEKIVRTMGALHTALRASQKPSTHHQLAWEIRSDPR